MAGSPTPKSAFLVWGQALYRFRAPPGGGPDQHRLLFAVSDAERQWLAWYYYSGNHALDYILIC